MKKKAWFELECREQPDSDKILTAQFRSSFMELVEGRRRKKALIILRFAPFPPKKLNLRKAILLIWKKRQNSRLHPEQRA